MCDLSEMMQPPAEEGLELGLSSCKTEAHSHWMVSPMHSESFSFPPGAWGTLRWSTQQPTESSPHFCFQWLLIKSTHWQAAGQRLRLKVHPLRPHRTSFINNSTACLALASESFWSLEEHILHSTVGGVTAPTLDSQAIFSLSLFMLISQAGTCLSP